MSLQDYVQKEATKRQMEKPNSIIDDVSNLTSHVAGILAHRDRRVYSRKRLQQALLAVDARM